MQMTTFDHLMILKHPYGCSPTLGKDHENTKKILADAIHHPNAGVSLYLD